MPHPSPQPVRRPPLAEKLLHRPSGGQHPRTRLNSTKSASGVQHQRHAARQRHRATVPTAADSHTRQVAAVTSDRRARRVPPSGSGPLRPSTYDSRPEPPRSLRRPRAEGSHPNRLRDCRRPKCRRVLTLVHQPHEHTRVAPHQPARRQSPARSSASQLVSRRSRCCGSMLHRLPGRRCRKTTRRSGRCPPHEASVARRHLARRIRVRSRSSASASQRSSRHLGPMASMPLVEQPPERRRIASRTPPGYRHPMPTMAIGLVHRGVSRGARALRRRAHATGEHPSSVRARASA